uniref:ETS domain-containing protein n=1 Tax=Rhabditophanes sp. KR3021 TaxID=114890 RepID=A0AC35UEC0_9BILA
MDMDKILALPEKIVSPIRTINGVTTLITNSPPSSLDTTPVSSATNSSPEQTTSSSTSENLSETETPKKKKQPTIHLHKFIRELLNSGQHTDAVEWSDKSNGEFRFLDEKKIAQAWGERKGNPNMNYEKLTRGIRYYYNRKLVIKVSGVKHTYRFLDNKNKNLIKGCYNQSTSNESALQVVSSPPTFQNISPQSAFTHIQQPLFSHFSQQMPFYPQFPMAHQINPRLFEQQMMIYRQMQMNMNPNIR